MHQQQLFLNFLSLRFHLRQRKQQVPTTIYAVFSLRGKTYRINTTIKVLPSQWHTATQRAIISSTFCNLDNENNLIVNNRLNKIEFDFAEKKIYLCNNLNLNCNYIYHLIYAINPHYMARKKVEETTTRPTVYDTIYTMLQNRVQAGALKESSLERTYKPYLNNINNYINEHCNVNEISVLNYNTIHKYSKHLSKTQTSTYARKVLKCLKGWLRDIELENIAYTYDTNIDKIDIKNKTIAKKDKYYYALTLEEINRIYNLSSEQLSNSTKKRLAYYRDMFVMLCTTGARCSDIQKLFESKNYDPNTQTLTFEAKKNENKNVDTCIVPYTLYPMTLEIYERYRDTTILKSWFDNHNKFNEAIKEIGRLAGLQETIEYKQNKKGGGIINCQDTKYNLLSSHSGRHSFITNAIRHYNLTADEIIEITGHADTQYISAVYSNLTEDDRRKRVVKSVNKATNKNDTPIPTVVPTNIPPQNNAVVNSIDEAKAVLSFLGCAEDDYIEETNIYQLIRLIGMQEGRIIDRYANRIDIQQLKELFNASGKISERKRALHALFSEIALQQK